jgi:hypothetical protein
MNAVYCERVITVLRSGLPLVIVRHEPTLKWLVRLLEL